MVIHDHSIYPGEHSQGELFKDIVGDQLAAEMGAFTVSTDHWEEIQEVPFVYFPNTNSEVFDDLW